MLKTLRTRIGTPEAPPPWGIGAAVSTLVAALAAVLIGSTIALTIYCGSPANAPFCQAANFTPPPTLTLGGWTLGALITIAFIGFTRRSPAEQAALRLSQTGASVFLVLLIGIGLAVLLDVVTLRLPGLFLPEPELLSLYGRPLEAVNWIFAAAFMALAQPIAEELVFRGILLPSLRQMIGPWPGFCANALLYAGLHLIIYSPAISDLNGLWYGFFLPFVSGLIFSMVRLYTGSTRAAILTHAAFGLFAVIKLIVLGTGV